MQNAKREKLNAKGKTPCGIMRWFLSIKLYALSVKHYALSITIVKPVKNPLTMQKFNLHRPGENATVTVVVVLFFTALVMFSYWFTHS